MLLRDVDKKLDMFCTIAIRQKSAWVEMSARLRGNISARLFDDTGRLVLQVYFPKRDLSKSLVSTILASKGAMEKPSYYTVSETLPMASPATPVLKIARIPSVIVSETYLLGNELFISFRFHSSCLKSVNDSLVPFYQPAGTVRIVYLGRTPGIINLLGSIGKKMPLTVVRTNLKPKSTEQLPENAAPTEYVWEGEVRWWEEHSSRVVVYSHFPLDWAKTISRDDGIYEMTVNEPFYSEMINRSREARIPLMASFGRSSRELVEIATIIPKAKVEEFLAIFHSIASDLKESAPLLDTCVPFDNDMWNWL